MHIAVAKVSLTKLLDELKNNHKYNSTMRLEKGLKMLIISSYPPRECGLATFSNDIVNAVKLYLGYSPIEGALQNNGIEYKYNQEVTYTLSATNLNEYRS
jgi:hypothetical protein